MYCRRRIKFPNLWLYPEYQYPSCNEIIHPLCGNFSLEGDSYRCGPCDIIFTAASMDPVSTKIEFTARDAQNCLISTVTESTDTSSFKSIEKDYFIRSDQHHNSVTKDKDETMWKMLRSAVGSEIDKT